jgi:hypothetical protein
VVDFVVYFDEASSAGGSDCEHEDAVRDEDVAGVGEVAQVDVERSLV